MQTSGLTSFLADLFTKENALFFISLVAVAYIFLLALRRTKSRKPNNNAIFQALSISAIIAVVAQISGFSPSEISKNADREAQKRVVEAAIEKQREARQEQQAAAEALEDAQQEAEITIAEIEDAVNAQSIKERVENVLAEAKKAANDAVDLSGQDLRGANFAGVDLKNANLANADLRNASLIGVDLEGADLKGAKLQGAVLVGANLAKAKNLTAAQLKDAIVNKQAQEAANGQQLAPTALPKDAENAEVINISDASAEVQERVNSKKQAAAESQTETKTQ